LRRATFRSLVRGAAFRLLETDSQATGLNSTAIIVIGGHRTGTSVTAQIIDRLGFPAAPSEGRLLRPRPSRVEDNPEGYWEDLAFVRVHRRMLSEHRKPFRWWNPRRDESEIERQRDRYRQLIRGRATVARWSLKDPRLCLLSDVLAKVLRESRIHFQVVTTARSRSAVCASLARRGLCSRTASVVAERFEAARVEAIARLASEGVAVHSVDYDQLVQPDATAGIVCQLAEFLGVPHSDVAVDAVKPFLDHGRDTRQFPNRSPSIDRFRHRSRSGG
jgi:hypothetical protein